MSALVSAAERGAACERRALHHHKARPLKVSDQALCDDRRHEFVRVVHSLAALEPEREGQGVGGEGRFSALRKGAI